MPLNNRGRTISANLEAVKQLPTIKTFVGHHLSRATEYLLHRGNEVQQSSSNAACHDRRSLVAPALAIREIDVGSMASTQTNSEAFRSAAALPISLTACGSTSIVTPVIASAHLALFGIERQGL